MKELTKQPLNKPYSAHHKIQSLAKRISGLAFFIAAILLVSSCNTLVYQVYEVKSNGLEQRDNALVYENADCKISYNLWSEDGNAGFIMYNKTDKNIFVNKKETFFIKNGLANNYYKNREYSSHVATAYAASNSYFPLTSFSPFIYAVPTDITNSKKLTVSRTVTEKEEAVICIPPHSWKFISEYYVYPSVVKTCNSRTDCPKTSAEVQSFGLNDSPVKFSNRIAYSFDANGNNPQYIDNNFYIASIKNYSEKGATKKMKEKIDCSDMKVSHMVFKIGGPDKFYKTFKYKGFANNSNTFDH